VSDHLPARPGRRPAAVALRYRHGDDPAPRITASGTGAVAERILEIAREHDLPLREDPDLVEALALLDLNAMIPAELYEVIAEVLAWAYRANSAFASTTRGLASP
jgi:flagellar biosynthesis protein